MIEAAGSGAGLYWNPGAIGFSAQILLAATLSVYLGKRVLEEWRQGHRRATPLIALTAAFLAGSLFVSLPHAMSGGGWATYLMPWLSPASPHALAMSWVVPLGGAAALTMVQFAYRFPRELPRSKGERLIVGLIIGGFLVIEVVLALRTDLEMLAGRTWFRPDWLAAWMALSMLWASILFVRQLIVAQAPLRATAGPGRRGRLSALLKSVAARPISWEATAARGFLFFMLLPVTHTLTLLLQQNGLIGPYSMDVVICWSVLAQLTGLALVYLGYLPERSSFQFKLTTVNLALLLATVDAACWIIAPGYVDQFRAPGMISAGRQVRFAPEGPAYLVGDVPIAPQPSAGMAVGAEGRSVDLPFAFRFYGRDYRRVHIAADGVIGLDHTPRPIDVTFGYGRQPAIYPLLVAPPAAGTDVTASVSNDALIVTRRDRCPRSTASQCYGFQAVLHDDGRIDFIYLFTPSRPRFELFEPMTGPWLMGITPGQGRADAAPVIRDYYHGFLMHLDRLYAPVVAFMIAAVLAVLLGMPLLFRGFLVRPLERLMAGMREFRDGRMQTQVPVTFHDEVGYLTESFNAMARSQNEMVSGLEIRVAQRVAEVTDVTARNAQLEERNRLSAELHDSVSQTLFSAALLADALPDEVRRNPEASMDTAGRVAELHRHALNEMRMLIAELRAEAPDDQPLGPRLATFVEVFALSHDIEVEPDIIDQGDLPPQVRTAFYRIAQESLVNIAKHARAGRVEVGLEAIAGQAMLRIVDDGRGFDIAHHRIGHFGLEIMRQRAERIDASLEIDSAPGRGTAITLIWLARDA